MELLQSVGKSHSTAERNHWVALSIGRRQSGNEIGDTRAGSTDRHACFPSDLPDPTSNKRRVLFVAADYGFYAGVTESVENFVYLCSGNAEDMLHPVRLQRFYNHVSPGLCLQGDRSEERRVGTE